MTNIDFYILQQDTPIARIHFLCRLVEKAVNRNHHIAIVTNDEEQAIAISDYLWSFKPESFLPHDIATQHPASGAPIALTWEDTQQPAAQQPAVSPHQDILINLGHQVPQGFSQYQRVIEIVVQDQPCLQETRQHFQFYRDRGYPLKSHKL